MKKLLLTGVLAAAFAALAGMYSTGVAAQATTTYSVYVHLEYPNGFIYEQAIATGVEAVDLETYLAACGRNHRYSNWLKLRCFALPE